jgi:hypothetical protein
VEIRFVSSLTEDDEARFAPAIVKALTYLLAAFPIVYTVRIETAGGRIFQSSRSTIDPDRPGDRHAGDRHGGQEKRLDARR